MIPHNIKIINSYEEFKQICKPWNELLRHSDVDQVYLRHEWFDCLIRAYRLEAQLSILTIWRDGLLTGIAPLIYKKKTIKKIPFNCLSFIQSSLAPRCNLIVQSRNDLDTLLSNLNSIGDWDLSIFENIDIEKTTSHYLFEYITKNIDKNLLQITPARMSPYIHTVGKYDDYFKSLSRNTRKFLNTNVRNRFNKLENGRIQQVDNSYDSNQVVDLMIDISNKSWKFDVGTSVGQLKNQINFFKYFTPIAQKNNWIDIWVASSLNSNIAIEYYTKYNGIYVGIKADYDKDFAYYHPGENIKLSVFRHMFNSSCLYEYDFSGNAYLYKKKFTKLIRKHVTVTIANNSLKGMILMRGKNKIRKLSSSLKKITLRP